MVNDGVWMIYFYGGVGWLSGFYVFEDGVGFVVSYGEDFFYCFVVMFGYVVGSIKFSG